jgi:chitinase
LSIGGWGGSQYFSSAVATAEHRTAFARTVLKVLSQYNLDGVEFECAFSSFLGIPAAHPKYSWEFPGRQGIGCNIVSEDDTANFLSFLKTLHVLKGKKKLIVSAAVSLTPFVGSDGNPLSDVSAFEKVLDYIGSSFLVVYFI